jgi:hypothetical protein
MLTRNSLPICSRKKKESGRPEDDLQIIAAEECRGPLAHTWDTLIGCAAAAMSGN